MTFEIWETPGPAWRSPWRFRRLVKRHPTREAAEAHYKRLTDKAGPLYAYKLEERRHEEKTTRTRPPAV